MEGRHQAKVRGVGCQVYTSEASLCVGHDGGSKGWLHKVAKIASLSID